MVVERLVVFECIVASQLSPAKSGHPSKTRCPLFVLIGDAPEMLLD